MAIYELCKELGITSPIIFRYHAPNSALRELTVAHYSSH
jgi:hypothetical protein